MTSAEWKAFAGRAARGTWQFLQAAARGTWRVLKAVGRGIAAAARAAGRFLAAAGRAIARGCKRLYYRFIGTRFYQRYREQINYIVFGVCTFLIHMFIYYLLIYALDIHYVIADNVGFLISVIFAYYTNKRYVYHDSSAGLWDSTYKFIMFVGARLVGQLLETVLLIISVEWMEIDEGIAKWPVTAIVVLINYLSGKLLVFTKQQATAENREQRKRAAEAEQEAAKQTPAEPPETAETIDESR